MSLDKKALVTPRASSSATIKQGNSTAKQPSLITAFRRQERAAASSSPRTATRRPKGKGKENAPPAAPLVISSDEDDGGSRAPRGNDDAIKPGFFSRLFGKAVSTTTNTEDTSPSSAVSARRLSQQSRPSKQLGKRIINPPADQRRRGPTIDFDTSQEPPADENEMEGETQRRKRKRVQEGGRGQLDLVPVDDHEGFGGRTQPSGSGRKRVKRELELERASQQTMAMGEESAEEEFELEEQQEQEQEQVEDSWEPEPSTAPDDPMPDQPPSSQHPMRSYAESSEGGDDFLQQQLVPRREDTSVILVPDSDDLAPMSSGEGRWEGAGMADDSGFAEMDDEPEAKDESMGSILPPHLTSSYRSRPPKTLSAAIKEEAMDEDAVPESQPPFPSLVRDHRSIGRTPSGILMPPPPLPRRRSSPSDSAVEEPSSPRSTTPPTDSPHSKPVVLVPNTQLRDNSISPHRAPLAKNLGPTVCEETQLRPSPPRPPRAATPPVASTSRHATISPRRHLASTWDSLTSAWAGQRPPSPSKPASPRQSRLNEFFRIPSLDNDNETQLVEDSQPTCVNLTLEQAAAFHRALQTTREMGRAGSRGSLEKVMEEQEEVEDIVEENVAMVATSDAEEEPWSPLGSPTKFRYPTLQRPSSQSHDDRQASQLQSQSQSQARAPTSSEQRSADQLAQLETQWESYWSEETFQPFVPLVE